MHELTLEQVEQVSGGTMPESAAAFGLAVVIGNASFGSGFGLVGAGLAFASAPFAVGAMLGLAFYAGFRLFRC